MWHQHCSPRLWCVWECGNEDNVCYKIWNVRTGVLHCCMVVACTDRESNTVVNIGRLFCIAFPLGLLSFDFKSMSSFTPFSIFSSFLTCFSFNHVCVRLYAFLSFTREVMETLTSQKHVRNLTFSFFHNCLYVGLSIG